MAQAPVRDQGLKSDALLIIIRNRLSSLLIPLSLLYFSNSSSHSLAC